MQSNVQRVASELGVAIVCPDTSPRDLDIEGEADVYSFGVGTLVRPVHSALVCSCRETLTRTGAPAGAGFYLNATEEKWKNWRMYDYVVKELPALLGAYPPPNAREPRTVYRVEPVLLHNRG